MLPPYLLQNLKFLSFVENAKQTLKYKQVHWRICVFISNSVLWSSSDLAGQSLNFILRNTEEGCFSLCVGSSFLVTQPYSSFVTVVYLCKTVVQAERFSLDAHDRCNQIWPSEDFVQYNHFRKQGHLLSLKVITAVSHKKWSPITLKKLFLGEKINQNLGITNVYIFIFNITSNAERISNWLKLSPIFFSSLPPWKRLKGANLDFKLSVSSFIFLH